MLGHEALREDYIDHILDGCDFNDLLDMAREHLEATVENDPDKLILIVEDFAPHLLEEFED